MVQFVRDLGRELVSDAVILCGAGALVYGVAAVFGPGAGWIAGGVIVIGLGVLLGMRR